MSEKLTDSDIEKAKKDFDRREEIKQIVEEDKELLKKLE